MVFDECLPHNILVFLDYSHHIYLQSPEPLTINSLCYNMSLLSGIKLHQLPASSVELKLIGYDVIWNNFVIESADP
jgi:hypothetical protein